jgi:cell division protein FtsL
VFFHITDFPKGAGGEPKVGERLKFLIVKDNGKSKAANISRLDLKRSNTHNQFNQDKEVERVIPPKNRASHKGMIFTIIGVVIIAILMGSVFQKYQVYQQSVKLKTAQLIEKQKKIVEAQRQAIGDLPKVKFSEKTENALKGSSTYEFDTPVVQNKTTSASPFRCDGRTHCSQMTSLAEAKFFISNCPDTRMDGNHDGEPCERQFRR